MTKPSTPLFEWLRVETPLGLFSVLWAFGSALHTLEDRPFEGLPTYLLVVLLLLNPERLWAIASFAMGHATLMLLKLPTPANHSVVALLVDLCLLIGCLHAWRRRDALNERQDAWTAVRGPIKATLLVVYFFAVFHKLNSSFFDPIVSCAVSQVNRMVGLHGISGWPADPSIFRFNIYVTLIVETAILVLLLWPRFTRFGVLLGLAFHVGLGWARFYDFATVAFALYLFFLPWEDVERNMRRIPKWVGLSFLTCFAALAMTSILFYGIRGDPVLVRGARWSLTADTFICLFWTLAIVPIVLPIYAGYRHSPTDRRWSGARLAWVIPVIALLNGATSYLGLKTVANYSMFSNLRTEGGRTNHFLIPAGRFFIAHGQDDLVHVRSYRRVFPVRWPWWSRFTGTGTPRWRSELPRARVPFADVRRVIQSWPALGVRTASIVYERNGQRHDVKNAFADAEIMRPMAFWERWLFAYRAVAEDGEETICRW